MRSALKVSFLLFLLALADRSLAQINLRFKKISVKDGLSQSTITFILQDSRGYIWISTADGLNRYDGYSFTVFRNNPDDPTSIATGETGSIIEDENHRLWITTRKGISVYDPRTEKFTNYAHNDADTNSLVKCYNYFKVFQDASGRYWIATESGLELLDEKTGKFRHFRHAPGNANTIPDNNLYSGIATDGHNRLWISTDSGLCIMNLKTLGISPVKNFPARKANRIFKDSSGQLLFVADSLFYRLDESKLEFHPLKWMYNPAFPLRFKADQIISLVYDKYNNVYWAGGWIHFTPLQIKDSVIFVAPYTESVPWAGGHAVCIDASGNLWAGGEGTELYRGDLYNKFLLFTPVNPKNLSASAVWHFSEDANNNLWIEGQDIGMLKRNIATGETQRYAAEPGNPYGLNGMGLIFCDSKGNIWVEGGLTLHKHDEKTDRFKQYKADKKNPKSHPPKNLSGFYERKDGTFWAGSFGWGLGKFFPKTGEFEFYKTKRMVVRCIYEDDEENVWIGTAQGFEKFDQKRNQYIPLLDSSQYKSEISAIVETEKNFLWLGSATYGLLKFDKKSGKVAKQYSVKQGLCNNNVYAMIYDSLGNLWISTNLGLSRFNIATGSFRNFDYSDGLQNNEFNGQAAYMGKSGWIYFGGPSGYNAFRPENIKNNPFPPKVLITGIKLYNKPVEILSGSPADAATITEKDGNYLIPMSISFIKELGLNYNQNFLSFDFAALHYSAPEKNQYAYMLEGLESKWNESGTRRFASYSNIPPGDYVFRVKASNSDGVWNETGASIHIIIYPPFWQTWWFRTLMAIVAGTVLYILYRWRTASLRKRKEELEQTVKERTAEVIEQKEEIEKQKELIEERNKDMTDSINYAKRIQEAILPQKELKYTLFPDAFVLFQPKDVVSGDFYWFAEKNGKRFIAAVDCTGHGVPGAFMSMIGNAFLNEIVNERGITEPGKILSELRFLVIKALKQTGAEGEARDGMDISLLCFSDGYAEWAGANNPLWLMQRGKCTVYLPDKRPIGFFRGQGLPFTNNRIEMQKEDTFYIFTDGYADQFGGEKGKKFKYKQLQELLISIQPEPMLKQEEILLDTLNEWKGNLEQVDDVLVIGVRV